MEVQVSRHQEERDECLNEFEPRHAKELDRVQGRLQDFEAAADSCRAQLNKAVSDQKCVLAPRSGTLKD